VTKAPGLCVNYRENHLEEGVGTPLNMRNRIARRVGFDKRGVCGKSSHYFRGLHLFGRTKSSIIICDRPVNPASIRSIPIQHLHVSRKRRKISFLIIELNRSTSAIYGHHVMYNEADGRSRLSFRGCEIQ
jgi:hypothetical protein